MIDLLAGQLAKNATATLLSGWGPETEAERKRRQRARPDRSQHRHRSAETERAPAGRAVAPCGPAAAPRAVRR